MALDSKKYTRVGETLFDILDAVADGLAAAGEGQEEYQMSLNKTSKHLCMVWANGQNSVMVQSDVNGDSCVVVVSGDGAWYTNMIGPLDTLFP